MIRMIAGVYGMKVKRPDGRSYIRGMGVGDGSFSLDPEREAELVGKGVAEYVSEPAPSLPPEDMEAENSSEAPELPGDVIGIPRYSADDTTANLRKIGEMCGLTFKAGMSRSEMVAALDAHFAANTKEDPETVPEDVEPAPIFDAAEAVK